MDEDAVPVRRMEASSLSPSRMETPFLPPSPLSWQAQSWVWWRPRSKLAQMVCLGVVCLSTHSMTLLFSGAVNEEQHFNDPTIAFFATLALSSILAPAVVNLCGSRATLFVGSLGYIPCVLRVDAVLGHGHVGAGVVGGAGARARW